MSREGIDTLVSMLVDEEVNELGLQQECAECDAAGINFVSVVIPDPSVPSDRNAFLSRLWRSKPATWTWALPVFWFTIGFVLASLSRASQSVLDRQSVWSQFSGNECVSGLQSLGCGKFFLFSLPLIRGTAYSLGAYISLVLAAYSKRLAEIAAPSR